MAKPGDQIRSMVRQRYHSHFFRTLGLFAALVLAGLFPGPLPEGEFLFTAPCCESGLSGGRAGISRG